MRTAEPDWISSEPQNHAVLEILHSYLENVSTNPPNLQNLVNSTLASLQSAGTQEPSADQYKADFYILSGILLTIAKSLPATCPKQGYLVELLVTIRNTPLPATVQATLDEYDPHNAFNFELTPFIRAYSSFESDAPLYPPLDERAGMLSPPRPPWRLQPGTYLSASAWTNLNAFLARLHVRIPSLPHVDLRGLFAMMEALETPLTPTPLQDVVPAAAAWIVVAGRELKNNRFPYARAASNDTRRRLPWSRGELWTGPLAFNGERWEFWMQRFRQIREIEGVGEEVREACGRAVEVGEAL